MGSGFLILTPPAVTDIAYNSERGESKVKDPGVHAPGGFFTELLSGFGTNGTLGSCIVKGGQQKNNGEDKCPYPLFHSNPISAKIFVSLNLRASATKLKITHLSVPAGIDPSKQNPEI
jgi:hypothetical protein